MSPSVNRRNIGIEHNEINVVAKRLLDDGEIVLAKQYQRRAATEESAYSVIADLGSYAINGLFIPSSPGDHRVQVGADLADWLLANGWPAHPALIDADRIKDDDQ